MIRELQQLSFKHDFLNPAKIRRMLKTAIEKATESDGTINQIGDAYVQIVWSEYMTTVQLCCDVTVSTFFLLLWFTTKKK